MSIRRLLLADDSLTIQKVVNLTFAEEGIEVITAGDGNTAMEKFVQMPPDLVMVDVNMPGFDGYKICEMIKQDEETKQIPVILLVGSFEPFDEEEARRVGADDFLTKPFQSIRQLVSRVTDLLNRPNGNFQNQTSSGAQNHIIEAATVNNFAHSAPLSNNSDFQLFEDNGMDDEMIQTNQISNHSADETEKFEPEPSAVKSESENDFSFQNSYEKEEVSLETQPLTDNYYQQMPPNSADTEIFGLDEKIFDFADEPSFTPESKQIETRDNSPAETENRETLQFSAPAMENKNIVNTNSNQPPQAPDASIFDFDDLDLLDLPPVEKKSVSTEQDEPLIDEIPETSAAQEVSEKQTSPEANEQQASTEAVNLSPEVIEAITKKIMEKLSDKVIREIVQEVTPQTVESVIKEMTQKKIS